MAITVTPSGQACGAMVSGIDLARDLDENQIADIRRAWIEHGVLAFPGQSMDDDDLERYTRYFGQFGNDPFVRYCQVNSRPYPIKRGRLWAGATQT